MSIKINSIVQEKNFKNNNTKLRSCTNNSINRENVLERNPQRDSVSFKGQVPLDIGKIVGTKNTANGLAFAHKLINKISEHGICNFPLIAEVVQKQFPDVAVKPMQELAQIAPNANLYKAYSSCDISPTFKRIDLNMYLGLPESIPELPAFISDAAHEYTHISQYFNEVADIEILKSASKDDGNVSKTLKAIFESTFRTFDLNAITYLEILKEKDGSKIIAEHTKGIIRQLLEQINAEVDPINMQNVLKAYSNSADLVFDTKNYCAQKAKWEKEAYATEYALAQTSRLKNGEGYKQIVEFFSDLEDAFRAK